MSSEPTSYIPSANVAELHESATIAVSARAKELRAAGRPVIDLGAGEPDFGTPGFVIESAHRALDAGATRYTQVEGILPLRETIAARARSIHSGPPIDASQVVVSTGTKQALFNACFSLFGPGDEVLIPTPGWTSYYQMVSLARATPIAVRGARERQLKVTVDDLRRASTPRTKGLVLNSPCNPTGAVYSRAELAALVELAIERGWWIVSDEIYRAICYDGEAPSLLSVAADLDRLVVVDGVAKSFAMTGWRIGWSISTRPLARTLAALQSHTTSNATTLSQHAALAALENAGAAARATGEMVAELKERRDAALGLLRTAGLEVLGPAGAFYLFIHAGQANSTNQEPGTTFASRLLEEANVAVVPGSAFGSPEWIRVSYAAPVDQVLEGVRRIVATGISQHRVGGAEPVPIEAMR
ncbi:MAG TPA: pyridoxal phosphate-dependent aminotransferase [Gemmatimonadaceae bacterium]|nr:pyridoxal phosphate-dependent aminotransferase [Gemmatimonadaceae bacterium]